MEGGRERRSAKEKGRWIVANLNMGLCFNDFDILDSKNDYGGLCLLIRNKGVFFLDSIIIYIKNHWLV